MATISYGCMQDSMGRHIKKFLSGTANMI